VKLNANKGAKNMKISTIQSQHFLYDSQNPGEFTVEKLFEARDRVVKQVLQLTEKAAKKDSDLIVTTESINVSIFPGDQRYDIRQTGESIDGPLMRRFGFIAKKNKTYIVAGLYTTRDGNVYNSAVLFNPKGEIRGIYDKTHLTDVELLGLSAGNTYPIFETEFGNIAMLICWDMQYPEAVREVALAGADLVACPTWGWENLYGLCRAYESSVTIAAANALPPHGQMWEWCNPSAIVNNLGQVLAVGPKDSVGIVTAEVDIKKEPEIQYNGNPKGITSMRQIRNMLRRPESYKQIVNDNPPLFSRYNNFKI
jgi:predicted amidohydrolase